MSISSVYLCAAKRTPIGSFQGALAALSSSELGAQAIAAVLGEVSIDGASVDEVVMGAVLTAGVGQAPARQAAIKAGLPESVSAMTINKVCSSGLKAVMLAADSVRLGNAEAAIAGGMESMSNSPFLLPSMRAGARLGNAQAIDSIVHDGLWDVYNDYHMGCAAELCAREYSLSRELQDEFAIESYRRANAAIAAGHFAEEIASVTIKNRKGDIEVSEDEEPGRGRPDKIPSLRAVFEKEGTVTAANASSINDGAAAMLVCSKEYAEANGLSPLARIVEQASHSQSPEWFTTAPVGATKNVLGKAGLSVGDVDLFEVNEAFSAVALACQKDLEVPTEKLNISGGAVALGHPIGGSGARILTTLLYNLKRLNLKTGVAAICNGGGEATAMLVERV